MKRAKRVTRAVRSSSRSDVFCLPIRICFYDPITTRSDVIRSAIFLSHWARATEMEEIRLNLDEKIFRIVEA
jgi:hypothetical protein